MKWNKEIIAISASLFLLALLVINWGYNVYQNKISALQAESNVIFFEALETAKERMFLRTAVRRGAFVGEDHKIHRSFQTELKTDSLTILFHGKESESSDFPEHVLNKELNSYVIETGRFADSIQTDVKLKMLYENIFADIDLDGEVRGLEVQISDEGGDIFMRSDTIIVVDFDTTMGYLEKVFIEKMDTANLRQLKVKVFDTEDPKVELARAAFQTNPGKLGDVFFGRKTYAATVQNFGPLAIQKMIPEILFGLFLYSLIAAAFIIIYRSLMAQKKLVKIKDEFVGNITHELKTPISVVNVAIEAIQNFDADKDPEKTSRYLDISRKELSRLSGLVDKVLHLSVNPSEEAPTEIVDIVGLASQVVDAMQLRLAESDIHIQFQAPETPLLLNANVSQVKSVIYNLIDNAVKYSNKGTIAVGIEKISRRFMKIRISDQGIGIPRAYQDKIFDQFFRVPSGNVHDVKGYGLGLHNVKQIVEQYNGSINLKSEEGKGSTFIIKWPISNA